MSGFLSLDTLKGPFIGYLFLVVIPLRQKTSLKKRKPTLLVADSGKRILIGQKQCQQKSTITLNSTR